MISLKLLIITKEYKNWRNGIFCLSLAGAFTITLFSVIISPNLWVDEADGILNDAQQQGQ